MSEKEVARLIAKFEDLEKEVGKLETTIEKLDAKVELALSKTRAIERKIAWITGAFAVIAFLIQFGINHFFK